MGRRGGRTAILWLVRHQTGMGIDAVYRGYYDNRVMPILAGNTFHKEQDMNKQILAILSIPEVRRKIAEAKDERD